MLQPACCLAARFTIMGENLIQHRRDENVWDQRVESWDPERWCTAAAAGACVVAGVRRRSAGGLLLALAGGALAWWAGADRDERGDRRAALRWQSAAPRSGRDVVEEASEDSFPASDAPAWPTMRQP